MADFNSYIASLSGNAPQQAAYAPQQAFASPGGGVNYNDYIGNAIAGNTSFYDDYAALTNASRGLYGMGNEEPAGPREMNMFDRFAARANQATNWLSGLTGFDPEKGFKDPENLVRFAGSLPFQMMSVVPDTISHGYEALTGRPVLEGDLESNLMPGEDLTPLQRAADIGYTGINIAGTMAGGSGRVLGTAGKMAKFSPSSVVAKGAENMAAGMFKRAGIGGEKAAPFVQLTHDITEEGAEEFAQSYLEDTRFDQLNEDSFGRALESAEWGALGGGIMSGSMMGVNHYLNNRNPAQSNDNGQENPGGETQSNRNVYAAYDEARNAVSNDGLISTTALDEIKKQQTGKSAIERPGSITAVHSIGDKTQNVDDITLGTDYMRAMWRQGSKSQDEIMNFFGLNVGNKKTRETLDKHINNDVDLASYLNTLRNNRYKDRAAKIAIGRNPDTKNGIYYANLKDFTNGSAFHLNPLTYQIVGSDVDGDTSGVYLNTDGIQANGWASEMLLDAEGSSNVDYAYSDLQSVDWDGTNNNLRDVLDGIFNRYTRTYEDGSASEHFYNMLKNAVKDTSSNRNSLISQAFASMQHEIADMNAAGDYSQARGPIGRREAINKILYETVSDPRIYIDQLTKSITNKFNDNFERIWREYDETMEGFSRISDVGTTGDNVVATQMYEYIGMLTSASPRAGNPIYRQYAALGYNIAKTKKAIFDQVSEAAQTIGVENVFDAAIRETFKEVQAGIAPTTAIEGIIDGMIAHDTLSQAGMTQFANKSPRSYADFEHIANTFIKSYNAYVKIYNTSIDNLTDMGWEPALGKNERNNINDIKDPQFIRSFRKFIDSLPADSIFPAEALTGENADLTCGQLIEKYNKDKGRFKEFLRFYDKSYQKVFDRLLEDEVTEVKAIRSRINKTIKEFDLTGPNNRASKTSYDARDTGAMVDYMNALNNYIIPRVSVRLGLLSPNDMIKTKLGKMLLSDRANERINAIQASNYLGKYLDIIEYYADLKDNQNIDDRVIEKLHDLAEIDAVHATISEEIEANNGRSLTLERLIDIDEDFDIKESWFKDQFGDTDAIDIVVSSMQADADATSTVNQRMTVAQNSLTRYKKNLLDNDIRQVDELVKMSREYPNASLSGYLNGQAAAALCEYNMNILGMEFHDAAVVSNKNIEKATIADSYVHKANAIRYDIHGGIRSYLSTLTSLQNNKMTMEEFCQNRRAMLSVLSDPSFKITIEDTVTGRECMLTRDKLFKDLCDIDTAGRSLNDNDWRTLLTRCPQLVGWLSVGKVQASTSGGNASDGWATSKNLADGYKYYVESTSPAGNRVESAMRKRQFEEGRLQTGNWLLNQSWYLPYLCRCIPSQDKIRCMQDPQYATKVLSYLHRQYTAGKYAQILYMNDPKKSVQSRSYQRTVDTFQQEMITDNMSNLINTIKSVMELSNLEAQATMQNGANIRAAIDDITSEFVFVGNAMEAMKSFEINGKKLNFGDTKPDEPNFGKLNSRINDLSSMANQWMNDQYNAYLRTYDLVHIYMQNVLHGQFGTVNRVSSDVVTKTAEKYFNSKAFKKAIKNMSEEDRIKEKQRVYDILNRAADAPISIDAVKQSMNLSNFSMDIITKINDGSLFASKSENAFRDVLHAIGKQHGISRFTGDTSAIDSWVDDYLDCFDKDGTLDQKKADAIVLELNNVMFTAELEAINQQQCSDVNTNMFYSMTKDFNNLHGADNELWQHLANLPNSNGTKGYLYDNLTKHRGDRDYDADIRNMPKPKYDDRDIEIVVNQMIISEGAGNNPTNVNSNGAENKHQFGTDIIPKDIHSDIEPEVLTASQLYDMYQRDPNVARWNIVKPGNKWNPTDRDFGVSTVESQIAFIRDPKNANVNIEYFNPKHNPHGVYVENTPVSFNQMYREYTRLSGILCRVIDNSQEGMVLKAKKKFAGKSTIVDTEKQKQIDSVALKASDIQDANSAFATMRNKYLEFIDSYATAINDNKDVWQKQLGFGMEQATILAQGLTIGYRVYVTTPAGQVSITLDCGDLFNSAKFQKRYNEIQQLGTIESAEIWTVHPRTLSYRILNSIVDAANVDDNFDAKEAQRISRERITDWSDYQYDTLDTKDIMSNIQPLGAFHSGGLVASDSRTAVQAVINQLWGKDDNYFRSPNLEKSFTYFDKNKDSAAFNAINDVTNLLNINFEISGKDAKVVRVFMPTAKEDINTTKYYFDRLNKLDRNEYKALSSNYGAGIGVVYNPSEFSNALEWAYRTGQRLLIPNSIIDRIDHSMFVSEGTVEIAKIVGQDHNAMPGTEYATIINPTKAYALANRNKLTPESWSMPVSRKSISRILMDQDNTFGLPDAGGIVTEDTMRNILIPEDRDIEINCDNFFTGGHGPTKILSAKEIANLASELGDDLSKWKEAGIDLREYTKNEKFGEEELARRMKVYFSNVASAGNHQLTNAVSAGDVVAIVSNGTGKSTKYAPIIIPNNASDNITYYRVDLYGSKLQLGWTAMPRACVMNMQGYAKMTLAKEAMKGEVSIGENIPKGINGVMNYMTEKGRVEGRDKILLLQNLYYETKLSGGHLLYEKDGDKFKWKIPEENQEATLKNKNVPENLWIGMKNGEQSAWNAVGITDSELQTAIKSVLRQCDKFAINPSDLFGAKVLAPDMSLSAQQTDCMYDAALGQLNEDQILKIFHAINNKLCPNGLSDANADTTFDIYGRMKVDGMKGYQIVRIGKHNIMGGTSATDCPGGIASYAMQHLYRRCADSGLIDENVKRSIDYANFLTRNYSYIINKNKLIADQKKSNPDLSSLIEKEAAFSANSLYVDSYLEIKERNAMASELNNTMASRRSVYQGKELLDKPWTHPSIRRELKRFYSSEEGIGCNLNWDTMMMLINLQDGWTLGEGELTDVYANQIANTISTMVDNIKHYGTPIANPNGSNALNGRIAIPLMPRELADYMWENSPALRQRNDNKWNNFVENMNKLMDEAEVIINAEKLSSRRTALRRMGEAINRQWDRDSGLGYIYGGCWADEIVRADGTLGMAVRNNPDFNYEAYQELQERAQEMLQRMRNRADRYLRNRETDVATEFGGKTTNRFKDDSDVVGRVLDNATELTKMMALMNPGVLVSNMLDRSVHQNIMNASLHLGHKLHVGPYTGTHWLDQNIVNNAVNDPLLMKLYAAYRTAGLNGNEIEFIAKAKSISDIENFIDNKLANMTRYQKAVSKTFNLASGGNWLIKGQMRNFINRFVMFAETTPGLEFWFQVDPKTAQSDKPVMMIEAMLANEPATWFVDILGGNGGRSASLSAAMKALNSAKQGDMAQRHCAAVIIQEITKRSHLGNFLFTTTISRFPNYSFNVTQRMLNWILPMSSLYYTFTETMANTEMGKNLDLETTQVHTSLKEALLVDITKMGIGAVAMMLIGVSGMFEPPDDEDKWGNPEEWLFCGQRVGESWWMQDMLGMAIPMAAFAKSAKLGKPNINLLINGTTQACYSNPVIKVADAVGFLFEPEGAFFTDYEADKLAYVNAEGGPPAYSDYLQANALSFGLSWVSQFFTPSFVREWYQNAQKYEHSYKKIYEETGTGVLTEEGEYGDTIPTTYADAMLRRTTRRNPFLGVLCNFVLQPETGYLAGQMPYTIYTDDYQRQAKEYWSIVGLDDQARDQKLFEIYAHMNEYSDMDELKATGFYLDYETKAALSAYIWDAYHSFDVQFNEMGANGQLSYDVLGDGDWDLGKQRYYELKQDIDVQKSALYDFYYDKIKNSYLSDPMQTYRRYNTTYAKDDKGEIYATGFHPQGVLPFVSAPGQRNNPEGTAGYENDWVTPSAATGLPLVDKRALVPVPDSYGEWPNLESWSENGDGDSYSKQGQKTYGTRGSLSGNNSTSTNGTTTGTTGGTGNKTSGGSGSKVYGGGRGGGGGGRSGGGGGSGRSFHTSITPPNMNSIRTMGRVNTNRANLDYLRPSFETKGSREAYKREDI